MVCFHYMEPHESCELPCMRPNITNKIQLLYLLENPENIYPKTRRVLAIEVTYIPLNAPIPLRVINLMFIIKFSVTMQKTVRVISSQVQICCSQNADNLVSMIKPCTWIISKFRQPFANGAVFNRKWTSASSFALPVPVLFCSRSFRENPFLLSVSQLLCDLSLMSSWVWSVCIQCSLSLRSSLSRIAHWSCHPVEIIMIVLIEVFHNFASTQNVRSAKAKRTSNSE